MRGKRTTVKRAILDQGLVSGIGNIYADESLWRAKLHFEHPTQHLTQARAVALLGHARDVMSEALAAAHILRFAVCQRQRRIGVF